MFQNINVEYEQEEINEQKSNSKRNYLKEIFSIQNILLYIITFGVSMVSFGEKITPFGISIFAAVCSNTIPAGIVFILAGIGSYIGLGNQGILTYLLTSLVFCVFSLIYRPKFENQLRNEKRKLGAHLVTATFLVQIMGIAFKTFYVYDFITSILATMITYVFYKIFANSLTVIKDYKSKLAFTIEEVIGASLLIAISVSCLFNFTIFGFSVRNILCILLVLILGWKNGILVGTTGGVTIGVVLGIVGNEDPMLIAAFALSRNDSRYFKQITVK